MFRVALSERRPPFSSNAYDYACQDPVNKLDLSGRVLYTGDVCGGILGCANLGRSDAPNWREEQMTAPELARNVAKLAATVGALLIAKRAMLAKRLALKGLKKLNAAAMAAEAYLPQRVLIGLARCVNRAKDWGGQAFSKTGKSAATVAALIVGCVWGAVKG